MWLQIDPHIYYLVLLPDDSDPLPFTLLHGFSETLLQRSSWIREILSNCPPTAHEAFEFSKWNLELRLACITPYCICFLKAKELPLALTNASQVFWIVLADDETVAYARQWAKTLKTPIHIVTPRLYWQETGPTLNFRDVQIYVGEVLACLDPNVVAAHGLSRLLRDPPERQAIEVECECTNHNVVLPNELVLRSVGGQFTHTTNPICGGDEVYVKHMVNTAEFVEGLSAQVSKTEIFKNSPIGPTLIVTCPSMYKHVVSTRPPKGGCRMPIFRMLRTLQRQTTYAVQFENQEEADELLRDPDSRKLIMQRTSESSTYTDAVSARAASYVCPVLRLPPGVNHVQSQVKPLRDCLLAKQPQVRKIRRVTDNLANAFSKAIPSEFMQMIDQDHSSIKLVCDVPLEWLPVRGLPLVLRQVVSRIPATPGNLSFQQTLPREQVELTLDSFSEILVVRSFNEFDPLRKDMEIAISHYCLSNGQRLPVRFEDVRNSRELVEAINGFSGAMLIYDGHGSHGNDEIATLNLVDEEVNCWNLSREIKCPPIVFACGCDTHRAEGSHVTTANAFLRAGAMSVIASAMPIHSNRAAMFVGRLLFNIFEYVRPAIIDNGYSIRFDHIFGAVQKMMFVSDFIWRVGPAAGFTVESLHDLQVETNMTILARQYDWFEQFLEMMGHRLGKPPTDVSESGRELLPFAECLKYFHLGNPDLIVIRPADLSAIDSFRKKDLDVTI